VDSVTQWTNAHAFPSTLPRHDLIPARRLKALSESRTRRSGSGKESSSRISRNLSVAGRVAQRFDREVRKGLFNLLFQVGVRHDSSSHTCIGLIQDGNMN